MGLFSKLFGGDKEADDASTDDGRESEQPASVEEQSAEPDDSERAAKSNVDAKDEASDAEAPDSTDPVESSAADANADNAEVKPPVRQVPPNAAASSKSEPKPAQAVDASDAAAKSMNLADAIRRRRQQTNPGVAPPAPRTPNPPRQISTSARPSNGGGRPSPSPRPIGTRRPVAAKAVLHKANGSMPPPATSPVPESPAEAKVPAAAAQEPSAIEFDRASLRTLEVFRLDLHLGPVTTRWATLVTSSVKTLADQARNAGQDKFAELFEQLQEVIKQRPIGAAVVEGTTREQLLVCCARLRDASQGKLFADTQVDQCEQVMLRQVFAKFSGLGPLQLERLRTAGYSSVSSLTGIKAQNLAQRVLIEVDLAQGLLDAVAQLVKERSERLRKLVEAEPARVLSELMASVSELDEEYQRACDSDDVQLRRTARRRRGERVDELELTLAQLGKSRLLEQMARLPVLGKVETLRNWIAEGRV